MLFWIALWHTPPRGAWQALVVMRRLGGNIGLASRRIGLALRPTDLDDEKGVPMQV